MCLRVERILTTARKELDSEVLTFYKMFDYEVAKNKLTLQHYYQVGGCYDGPGIYYEDTKIKHSLNHGDIIENGAIHATVVDSMEHVNCSTHRIYLSVFSGCIRSVPIKVKKKHIIAYGFSNDVCFTKFEITKKAWNDVVTEILKSDERIKIC